MIFYGGIMRTNSDDIEWKKASSRRERERAIQVMRSYSTRLDELKKDFDEYHKQFMSFEGCKEAHTHLAVVLRSYTNVSKQMTALFHKQIEKTSYKDWDNLVRMMTADIVEDEIGGS